MEREWSKMEKTFLHWMLLEGSACPSPLCTQLFPGLCSAVHCREGEHAKLPPQTGFHLDLSKERCSLETGRCDEGISYCSSISPPVSTSKQHACVRGVGVLPMPKIPRQWLFFWLLQAEKAMAPHSSTLAWKIPWKEEPDRLQSMGSLRVEHDWATSLSLFIFLHWRRKWQPTPVFLPGESQGWGSLVGCRLWGCTESDTTEVT